VKDAGAPAAAGDAPEGVVVTVEEHHDALLDEHRITTEAYDPLKDLVNYRRPSVALLEDYLSDSEVTTRRFTRTSRASRRRSKISASPFSASRPRRAPR